MNTAQEQFTQAQSLMQSGQLSAAATILSRLVESQPQWAEARVNLGLVLQAQHRFEEAIACVQAAIDSAPQVATAHIALGNILRDAGRPDAALAAYAAANAIAPDVIALNNCGAIHANRRDWQAAITCYRTALALAPRYRTLWENLGTALEGDGMRDDALAAYQTALQLGPVASTHDAYGVCLQSSGRQTEATTQFAAAIEKDPQLLIARVHLAAAHWERGDALAAVATTRALLAQHPQHADIHSDLLVTLHATESDPKALFTAHCEWAARHAAPLHPQRRHTCDRTPTRPLRIGYVSPDFREHPVAHFFHPLLAAHSPDAVHVTCYSDVKNPDAMTQALQQQASAWRIIHGFSDDTVATIVREDQIDILIDLAGHTAHHRLLVFARKPAPVQATYLGYFDTTGLTSIDYRITDAWADPPGAEKYYTEQLVRLPSGFNCYAPPAEAPAVTLRAPSNEIIFGSFNQLVKITPAVVALWAQLLREIPHARLLLKAGSSGDPLTQASYRAQFAAHGIVSDRLIIAPPVTSVAEHLGTYAQIDIALDPFPFNGATTTCEALWMGVPVITLAGQTHAGRVGTSVLSRVGLSHCIATTPEEYVAIAAQLANDHSQRATLRRSLRETMQTSSLCDAKHLTHELEAAYREMWRKWCEM